MRFAVEKTIDRLGRIVLPKSMRDYYGISQSTKLVLIPTEEGVLIKIEASPAHPDACKDNGAVSNPCTCIE